MPRLILSLVFLFSVVAAWATDARASGATLIVNEVEIAKILTGVGKFSPPAKAQAAAQVLLKWKPGQFVKYSIPLKPEDDFILMLGTRRVMTINKEESEAQRIPAADLAAQWAKAINQALTLPPLQASMSEVVMPPDGEVILNLTGTHARKANLGQSPRPLVKVTRGVGTLTLKGQSTGQANLTILYGPHKLNVVLKVLPYAAKLPQTLGAEVFGNPAEAGVVRSAVRTAILQKMTANPGASLQIGNYDVPNIRGGNTQTIRVPMRVDAPGSFPIRGEIQVQVRNSGYLRREEDLLFYSNEPENLRGAGRLYWGEIAKNQSARLLTHHCNRTSAGLSVVYLLANPNPTPARVAMAMGDAEPDQNPTLAGYLAGDVFFRAWLGQQATILEIPPMSAMPVIFRRLAPNDTTSCLATIQNISDGSTPLRLIGEAVMPQSLPTYLRSSSYSGMPWETIPSVEIEKAGWSFDGAPSHIYPTPLRRESFRYEQGGPWAFVRVGQKAISDDQGQSVLLGNFGVHYAIDGVVSNPTDRVAKIEVIFEASAGYSGALFTVDGQYMAARILQAKATVVLKKYQLNPGESTRIAIQTIPLSGAHYPATIMIRPEGGGS